VKGADPFEIDVSLDEVLENVKAKIAAVAPQFPVEQQKLICSGKILADGSNLQDQGVVEGSFLVLMMKPKASPAPASSAPAVAPEAPAQTPQVIDDGPGDDATVQMLCQMGFPAEEVKACLQAALGNADRAVEYLMNGIPVNAQAPLQPPPSAPTPAPAPAPAPMPTPAPAPTNTQDPIAAMLAAAAQMGQNPSAPNPMAPNPMGMPGMSMPGQGDVGMSGPLAQIRRNPLWNRLRHSVQKDPRHLNEVLVQLTTMDPTGKTLELIMENQDEFMKMLQEPVPMGMPRGGPMGAPMQGGANAPPAAMQPPPAPQLSAADEEAIQQLMSFGFPRAKVIEAYLICDRNQDRAASFLFDGGLG
jgi:UV excision repair protein RAD23